MAGCGNSELSADLFDYGLPNVTSIDFSSVAIHQMAQRNAARTGMEWAEMDVCAMALPPSCFELVVDKGLLDSLLCGEEGVHRASSALADIARVLKTGGRLLLVSHGSPAARVELLKAHFAVVEAKTLPKPPLVGTQDPAGGNHYLYACSKLN